MEKEINTICIAVEAITCLNSEIDSNATLVATKNIIAKWSYNES